MNLLKTIAIKWRSKNANLSQAFRLLRGQNSPKNSAAMPYRQVDIVFACVEKLLNTILSRSVPLILSTIDEEIVEGGPIYDRLFRNDLLPFDRFAGDWLGNYALFRDVFIRFENSIDPSSPFEVIAGPRLRQQIDLSSGKVRQWDYTDDAGVLRHYTPQQVRQTKNFNPYDPHHGTGPLAACDNAIQYCYSLIMRNASAMRNGAEPGVVLQAPAGANLTPEQITAILSAFDSRYAGADKTMSTALLTGGMEAKTLALKMVDLQASQIDQAQACRIAAAFGVPPQLVGLITEAQYSGGPAMRDFIFNTAMPLSALFANVVTEALCQRGCPSDLRAVPLGRSKLFDGRTRSLTHKTAYRHGRAKALQSGQQVFAWFDWDQHPVVQEARQEMAEKVLKFTAAGLPLDQIVAAYDLPFDTTELPWAREWFISAGQTPARWILDGGPDAVLGPALPEGEEEPEPTKALSGSMDRAKVNRIWHKYIASWLPLELEFQSAMRSYFRRQKSALIKQLDAAMKDSTADMVGRVVFDVKTENGKLKAIHKTFFERAAKLGAAQIAADVAGQSGEAMKETIDQVIRRQAMKQTLIASARKLKNVNTTTAARVADTLREGLSNGEGLPELRKRLESEASFSTARAQTIARTHTGSAVSAGRHQAAVHLGAAKKFWLTSNDGAVRQSHRQAETDHKDGIAVNEAFKVGGDFLLYPGDPGGSPANIVNCRCMELVQQLGEKSISLEHYDRAKWFSYTDLKPYLNERKNV